MDGSTHYRIKIAKPSAYMYVMYVCTSLGHLDSIVCKAINKLVCVLFAGLSSQSYQPNIFCFLLIGSKLCPLIVNPCSIPCLDSLLEQVGRYIGFQALLEDLLVVTKL